MSAQKVGVGTTSPSDALHIRAEANEDAMRVQVGTSTKLRVFNNGGTSIGSNNSSGTPQNGLFVLGKTGLGVSNPAHKLDVGGDINFTGSLQTDGIAGENGQVLMADGNGDMSWANLDRFQNFKDFIDPDDSNSWTVPPGVTEVLFELWGAGGGGSVGGGGGAGGYVQWLVDVTPGTIYDIVVGWGGTGQTNNNAATSGVATTILIAGSPIIQAIGGGRGFVNSPGIGGLSSISLSHNAIRKSGQAGQSNDVSFVQYNSTSYARAIHYGEGGSSVNGGFGGSGDMTIIDASTSATVYHTSGRGGAHPGGGGGGGLYQDGADGYVIVRW